MENKINVAQLLKDCPEGMELDCTMWDNVRLKCVDLDLSYPIAITYPAGEELFTAELTEYGCWSLAALLSVIPKHINEYNTLRIDIGEKDFSIWYDGIGVGVNTELPNITMENPVDACVEMIIKLHKNNML